jgi:hypothetical protein
MSRDPPWTVVLAVATAACSAPSASKDIAGTREIITARRQLGDYMAQCTKRYGYDPEAASKLSPNVLGPGEREWRGCVYEGIKKYLIPRTLSPEVYQRAIAEDRKMTEALADGKMRHAQRQARVQQLLEEIDRIEEANRVKLEMDRLEMEVRQDMRQRSLSPLLRWGAVRRSLVPMLHQKLLSLKKAMNASRETNALLPV